MLVAVSGVPRTHVSTVRSRSSRKLAASSIKQNKNLQENAYIILHDVPVCIYIPGLIT